MASTSPGTNITNNSYEDVSKTPRILFLMLFILISFVGNLFIIVVIFQNKKFRTVHNLLVLNLCLICIVDCVCNMSLVLGALMSDEWIYGQCMCQINNFLMNLVAFSTILTITSLTSDQFFVLSFSSRYRSWFSSYRFNLFLSYLWIHALTFSIPFLTNVVDSTFRPQLHLCTVNGNSSLAFLYSSLIACYILPLVFVIVFQILILRLAWIQNHSKKMELAEKQYTQMVTDSPQIHIEPPLQSYILYILVLCLSWLFLHAPFAITSNLKHYHYGHQSGENSLTKYPWELDATLIWMRFFFSSLVPCLTYFFRKDIWQSTKECILCRKHNSVTDMEVVSRDSDVMVKKMTILKSDNMSITPKHKEKEKVDVPVAFTVPVLFATPNGIHIGNTLNEVELDSKAFTTSGSLELKTSNLLQGKFMDVHSGDQEKPEELIGDTSDYDSSCEIDPFSVSQPVSTRNVVGTLHRTLSLSNPEIPACIQKEFAGTIGADSGLDLSGTAGSSAGNSIKAEMLLHEKQMRSNNKDSAKSRMDVSHGAFSDGITHTETSLNSVEELSREAGGNMHRDGFRQRQQDSVDLSRNAQVHSLNRSDPTSENSPTKGNRRKGKHNRHATRLDKKLNATKINDLQTPIQSSSDMSHQEALSSQTVDCVNDDSTNQLPLS